MKKAVFTGGGTAGHVTPNVAVFERLRSEGWSIEYIGSENGIERQIIEKLGGITYHPIASGKLRRYFDINNFKDPFRVMKGIAQSYRLLKRIRPNVVFSKGGFVTVPVIIASRLLRIPVVIHESDMTPGLANKISIPIATKICATFPETMAHLPPGKAVLTGPPIRKELYTGSSEEGRKLCGFHSQKPVLLVVGGSLGSNVINRAVRASLESLLVHFQVAHICGNGHLDKTLQSMRGYVQFEYVTDELPDLLAAADFAVSRAGSNFIFEMLAVRIPMLLIPLTMQSSRGDQLLNARSFEQRGYGRILYEEQLSSETLLAALLKLKADAADIVARMSDTDHRGSAGRIADLLKQTAST